MSKSQVRNKKIFVIVEGAVMVALATVLSYIRVYKLPSGGSITLLSMLPIVLFSIKYGIKYGLGVAFVYSLVQLFQGITDGLFGWGHRAPMLIACILLDYVLAFSVLGFAGMFRKLGIRGWVAGTVIAMLLRLLCHFASGVVIWKSVGEIFGLNITKSWLYSILYNGSYMLPEIIFTTVAAIIFLKLPQIKKLVSPRD